MALKLSTKIALDLKKIPKPVRIVLAVVPSVLLAVFFVFVAIMPKNKQINNLKQQISEQEKQIAKTQSVAGRLEDLIAENEKLKVKLKELQEHLPEENEISSLLKQVSDLAIESGLDIISWNPAPRRDHSSGIVYEVPVTVSLIGNYHRLGRFFSALTKLDRIVNIININLSGPKFEKKEIVLTVGFSALTFTAVSSGGLSQ